MAKRQTFTDNEGSGFDESRAYTVAGFVVAALLAAALETLFLEAMPADTAHRLALYVAIALIAGTAGHVAGKYVSRRTVGIRYGERVLVRSETKDGPGPWTGEPHGVITSVRGRLVQTPSGPKRMLWVRFDVPQFNRDGEGPYEAAEIDEDYLEKVREGSQEAASRDAA